MLLIPGDEHVFEAEPAYGGLPNVNASRPHGDTTTQWLRVPLDPRREAVLSRESQTVGP